MRVDQPCATLVKLCSMTMQKWNGHRVKACCLQIFGAGKLPLVHEVVVDRCWLDGADSRLDRNANQGEKEGISSTCSHNSASFAHRQSNDHGTGTSNLARLPKSWSSCRTCTILVQGKTGRRQLGECPAIMTGNWLSQPRNGCVCFIVCLLVWLCFLANCLASSHFEASHPMSKAVKAFQCDYVIVYSICIYIYILFIVLL